MKNSIENNEELQIVLDSFAQTLSEMREDISLIKSNTNPNNNSNPIDSPLTADLLNRIAETIDNAKKAIDEADLRKFINAVISVTTELQNRANKASAEFLNQKVAELKEIAKQPAIIENKDTIDLKSRKMWIVLVISVIFLVGSGIANYHQYQNNLQYEDNDIKYRYVQMKGGISYDDIIYLNKSYTERPQFRDSIKSKVIEFESLIRQKSYIESVKEQKDKDSKLIDKRIIELTK